MAVRQGARTEAKCADREPRRGCASCSRSARRARAGAQDVPTEEKEEEITDMGTLYGINRCASLNIFGVSV
ncbi:hypothetical protein Scep_009468 [Stephania cephalantha]|uniref:Uncharacterized protein n=1 Tax=Stephania cephalantha TaxID=152367 RepID=A0AAP0JVQ2_9MAGN